ncbi:hypothetical protein ACFQ0D_15725, partial [Micromonospora zhanjiangensis]
AHQAPPIHLNPPPMHHDAANGTPAPRHAEPSLHPDGHTDLSRADGQAPTDSAPWSGADHPPSATDLIPRTDAEASAWDGAIRTALADRVGGFEHGGMRSRIDLLDDRQVTVYRDAVVMRPDVVHPEHGLVGNVVIELRRTVDGEVVARYVTFHMSDRLQGHGFIGAFTRDLEGWFADSGVARIEVRAASTVGGYAWARAGFDWAPGQSHRAEQVLDRLRNELDRLDDDIALVHRWQAGDPSVDIQGLRERHGVDDPADLRDQLARQRDGAQDILDRAARHSFGSDGYPTPAEISRAGWTGQRGPESSWIGKRAMLGSLWEGVKTPQHVTPAHDGTDGGREARGTGGGQAHRLPESPGERPGDGVHLRLPDDGPAPGVRGLTDPPDHRATIAAAVAEAAGEGGGTRVDETRPADGRSRIERILSGELVEASPAHAPERHAAAPSGPLRHTVELPHDRYADGLRRTVDDLIARGYEPIRSENLWTDGRSGGVVTHWRDPGTGQHFQVRIDTPESRAAHQAALDRLAARGVDVSAEHQRDLLAREQAARAAVRVPEGLDDVRLPHRTSIAEALAGVVPGDHATPGQHPGGSSHRDTAPTHRDDAPEAGRPDDRQASDDGPGRWDNRPDHHQLPLVRGEEALQALRDFVRDTRSGLELTGDPEMRRYAEALRAEPGVVKIALHGLENGQVVVGGHRMSGADLARGLAELHRTGRIDLGTGRIKLVSCHSGAGHHPVAAALARQLGREVTGATDKVWTYLDGTEIVSSPDARDGRVPTEPADGRWRTFGPDGREIDAGPANQGTVNPATTAQPSAGGGTRAGPLTHVGSDGRNHAVGDGWRSHRDPDGHLHRPGDREGSYRDGTDHRDYHRYGDRPGTYRTERTFQLRDSVTGERVNDPSTDPSRTVDHHAVVDPPETHQSHRQPDEVVQAQRDLDAARQALQQHRDGTLRPMMDELGVRNLSELSSRRLSGTIQRLEAASADPAHQRAVRSLQDAALRHADLVGDVRKAAGEVPRAAARHVLADRFDIHPDDVLTGRPGEGGRAGGEFAVAGFDRNNHRLVVLETGDLTGSTHRLQDGTLTERGTPEYVRDVLQTSSRLHEHLQRHPELLDELHRALRRGDLTVEMHRVRVDVDGNHHVSVTTERARLDGLDLRGVADRLPPASSAMDARLGERLHHAAQRIAHVFEPGGPRHGIDRVSVVDAHTLDVQPSRGRPYRIELALGAADGAPFTVRLGEGGVHRVEFSADHADGLSRAELDRLVTRAIGHTGGEVAAGRGARLGRFVGLHGGRLNGHDALVNDPTPGRSARRPSHGDLVRLAEFDALARLHEHLTGPERAAVEAELGRFIERHGLREGMPGADVRNVMARRHLSDTAAGLLDDLRDWRRDSDPVVAGTRKLLVDRHHDGARITPVRVRDQQHFRVEPNNWVGEGRASFTYELRSGDVPGGVARFEAGGLQQHFVLVVDRAQFAAHHPDGPVDPFLGRRFRVALHQVITDHIRQEHDRAPDVPARLRDRVWTNAPSVAGAV